MIRLALDGLAGSAGAFLRAPNLMQHPNAGNNRGERGPKFMTQDGQEVVLRSVGGLGFGHCVFTAVLPRHQRGSLTLVLLNQSPVCRSDPSDRAVHGHIDHKACQVHTVSDQEQAGRG